MDGKSQQATIRVLRPELHPNVARCETLSEEIGLLSAHLNAANCRMLELIAEFDSLAGYVNQGARTTAHWLNWKCGYGLNAAREKVRTARALKELPVIRACFAKGKISYSKVRAITRVATPQSESYLLNIALHGTASHVEKLVRGYRWRIRRDDEMRADKNNQDNRFLKAYWDEDGMLVVRGRLTAEQGALFMKALETGRDSVDQDDSPVSADRIAKLDKQAHADVAAESREYFDPCQRRRRNQVDALVLMAETFIANGMQAVSGGDKYQLLLTVDKKLLDDDSHCGNCSVDNGASLPLETVKRIGCDASLRTVTVDNAGEPIDIGRRSRSIPTPMRQAMLKRDGGCRFPGCDQHRYVDGHHIQHWADGGETSLRNLVTLCHHHHRLMHEGGFSVRRTGANRFEFKSPRGNVVHDVAPSAGAVNDLDSSIDHWNDRMGVALHSKTGATRWRGEPMDYSWAVYDLMIRDGRTPWWESA